MAKRFVFLTALGLIVLASAAVAQDRDEPVSVPKEVLDVESRWPVEPVKPDWLSARDAGIEKLVRFTTRGAPQRLGFEKPPAIGELTFLDPLPEAVLQLLDVKLYAKGRPVTGLVKEQPRLTFPILQGGQVRSSLTIARIDGVWQSVSFGSAPLIRAVMRARFKAGQYRAAANEQPLLFPDKRAHFTIVSVTGLNQYFVSANGPRGSYFVPVYDNQRLNLVAGVPRLVADVILALVPAARLHGNLPT